MLTRVAANMLIHQSPLLQNNTVVVEGQAGDFVVDPGITNAEMRCLAARHTDRPEWMDGQALALGRRLADLRDAIDRARVRRTWSLRTVGQLALCPQPLRTVVFAATTAQFA